MNNLDRRTALRRLAIGASAAFGSAAFPGLTKAAAKTASAAGKVAGGGPPSGGQQESCTLHRHAGQCHPPRHTRTNWV